MIKLIITGLLSFFSFIVYAQVNNNDETTHTSEETSLLPDTHLGKEILPPQVSTGFLNRNPEIEHAKWSQDGENYAATFEKEGTTIRSEYNYDGTWIGDFTVIEKSEVPSAVIQQVEHDYQNKNIEDIYKVETEDGVLYQFSLSNGADENIVRFDNEGNQVEIGESLNNKKMDDSE